MVLKKINIWTILVVGVMAVAAALLGSGCCGGESVGAFDLEAKLKTLPGVRLEVETAVFPYKRGFRIWLTQPLDHDKPDGETFEQQLILSHTDVTRPVVLVTEGYSMGQNWCGELGEILNANELRVEYRFFGKSKPKDMEKKWQFLNLKQATADYHRIVGLFKTIYDGKWVSTGWSKGGQTSLTYRCYYPEDMAATVAYDAPMNLALEEPRIDKFFETVGTEECRKRLHAFQRMVLKNKDKLLPMFKEYAAEKKLTFSVGEEKAFEYVVLEYTFSFWQYNIIDSSEIPGEGASVEEMFQHLKRVVSFGSYADRSMNSPSMYQFCTEMGYYGYVQKHLKDLLSDDSYPNCAYAPQGVPLNYQPEVMERIVTWLEEKGDNVIYIYGGRDPWSAPQVELNGKTNAMKMIFESGNHFTFINTFLPGKKQTIVTTLYTWLEK